MKNYNRILGYTWDNMVISLVIEDGRISLPIVSEKEDFTFEDDDCLWVSSKERTRSSLRLRMPVQGEDPNGYVVASMDSKTLSQFFDQIKSCAYMLHEILYIDDKVGDTDSSCPESVRKLWKESLAPDTGHLIEEIISWLEKFIAEHLDKTAAEAYCRIDSEIYLKEQAIKKLEKEKAELTESKEGYRDKSDAVDVPVSDDEDEDEDMFGV